MYNLSLSKDRIIIYVTGLNSSIQVIAGELIKSNNPALTLRQLLPQLLNISDELINLDNLIDRTDKLNEKNKEITSKSITDKITDIKESITKNAETQK